MKNLENQKLIVLLIVFMGFSFCLKAQDVKNIESIRKDSTIVVKYEIVNTDFNQQFDVSLYVSRDGGQTYEGPLEAVSGDVGKGIREGKHRITWNAVKDINNLEDDIVFNVKADLIQYR